VAGNVRRGWMCPNRVLAYRQSRNCRGKGGSGNAGMEVGVGASQWVPWSGCGE